MGKKSTQPQGQTHCNRIFYWFHILLSYLLVCLVFDTLIMRQAPYLLYGALYYRKLDSPEAYLLPTLITKLNRLSGR